MLNLGGLSVGLRVVLCCVVALCCAPGARAENYPDRLVTIVVPAAPGSATDVIARIVGSELSKRWKQNVIVSNISGGGLNIGSKHVFDSTPDGYTLLVAPPTPLTTADLVYRDLSYSPERFVPISVLARVPNVLLARNSLPANSLAEVIAYAKAHPGKLNYGSQGVGTTSYLSFKLLEKLAGIRMVNVPYRGEVPILNDIMAGNVDLFFGTLSTATPLYKAGRLKALAVGSLQRSPFLPNVPTMAEQGYPNFQSFAWFAMAGPPKLPQSIANQISAEVDSILKDPAIRDKFKRLMLEPVGGTPAETAKFFAAERSQWGKVINDAGLKPQEQ